MKTKAICFEVIVYMCLYKCMTNTVSPPSGLLRYFSDGMLPLLKSFYADFFNPTGGGSDQDRWMRVTSGILTALLVSNRFNFYHSSNFTLHDIATSCEHLGEKKNGWVG